MAETLFLLLALIALALLLPPRWDPAMRIKDWQIRHGGHPEAHPPGHPDRWRDFLDQARRDQELTDYPGCARGIMNCHSQSCGCINESRRTDAFLVARARLLAEENDRA